MPDNELHPSEYISASEAARRRNVTPQAIYDLVQRRKLPAQRVGGHLLLRASDVDSYVPQKAGRPNEPNSRRSKKTS